MKKTYPIAGWLMLLALLTFNLQPSTAQAQGTAFTYQGQLQNNGSPASGTYNLTFSLFDTDTSGVLVAGPVTNNGVLVSNGLFTVLVDFGPGAFTGATNWLEIAVATNRASTFTTLTPRQPLTPTPYAIYAESASGLNGTLSASQLTSIGNANGGSVNFFVGPSGNSTTSGYDNTANGVAALSSNTTGIFNTANGSFALSANRNGSFNTANGAQALVFNTTGYDNTANGFYSLYSNTNGNYNTADGVEALYANTSGDNNIALGYQAGYDITTGSYNIDIGNMGVAGDNNIIRIGSGQSQTFIAGLINGNGGGLTNLNVSAAQLTSIGNTNGGSGNFFVGPSGNSTMSGGGNTANGAYALYSNMNGNFNTANGYAALSSNTNGSYNTANGASALLMNTTGSYNTADGEIALWFNTSGNNNTANGCQALASNTNGSYNTANGFSALYSNTSGSENTAAGVWALVSNTTGSGNIALGFEAGGNISTGSYNIDIGNTGAASDNNIIRIGASQTATYLAGTAYANGFALSSDRDAKENFTAVNAREVLAKVASLPVTEWNYKTDSKAVQHIGPMAQDFQAAFQLGTDNKHISVVDEGGVALAAIQGLNQKLNEKDAEIQKLEKKLDELQAVVKQLAAQK
ncbi:MAG: tail fiber domain-containing protein [Limisphaerales bacterium]